MQFDRIPIIWRKRLIILIILAIVLIGVWIVATLVSRIGKTSYEVRILPTDSKITLDGKNISNDTNYFDKGSYTLEVRRDGFESAKQTITVGDDPDVNYVALALNPQTTAANKYVSDHKQEYTEFEGFVGVKLSTKGKKFTLDNPLIANLPYRDPYYTIGYKNSDDIGLVITIHTPSPRYRYAAIQKIRDLGYDPANYHIQFVDYTNPLEATR